MIVIANLCPWASRIIRPRREPVTVFEVGGVPRGSAPSTLVITETYEYYRRLSMDPQTRATILAQETASDFLLHTTLMGPFMTYECRPAIWQCRGEFPTPEEIDENTEYFRRYCDRVVEEADEWDRKRQAKEPNVPRHTQRQKDCANWMLYKRQWLFDDTPESLQQCPLCKSTLASNVIVCPTCSNVIDPVAYEAFKEESKQKAASARAAMKEKQQLIGA